MAPMGWHIEEIQIRKQTNAIVNSKKTTAHRKKTPFGNAPSIVEKKKVFTASRNRK
jgi:hypothetical protein